MLLRPYQLSDKARIHEAWRTHHRVLLVAFMGTGKTVTYASIVRDSALRRERALILVHRVEILKQAFLRLVDAGIEPERIGVCRADDPRANPAAPIQLASVDTVSRRGIEGSFHRIIVDEAHHIVSPKFEKVLSWYPKAKLLGLTATPERLDGKPLDRAFDVMIISSSPQEMIRLGYLSEPEIWTRQGWTPDLSDVSKRGADYAPGELTRKMNTVEIAGRVVEHWKAKAEGRPTVAFAVSVDHARGIVESFNASGVTAELLTGETDDATRAKMIGPGGRVQTGETKVVVTCDVIGEGWDASWIRCLIDVAPTLSLTRNLQRWGRVTRPGLVAPIILDHAGNWRRFGFPCAERQWSLQGRPKRTGHGAPPVRVIEGGRVVEYQDEALVRADDADRQTVCAGFNGPCPKGSVPSSGAFSAAKIRSRSGQPWRCSSCAARKKTADPAWRAAQSERMRKKAADPAWRAAQSERMRKLNADRRKESQQAMTPAYGSSDSRAATATATPERKPTPARD